MRTISVKTIYKATCDKCHAEENADRENRLPDGWIGILVNGTQIHLCEQCASEFETWLMEKDKLISAISEAENFGNPEWNECVEYIKNLACLN